MNLNEALRIKTEKRIQAIDKADEMRRKLHRLLPRVETIDRELESMPMRAVAGENIETLRKEAEKLTLERADILTSAGFAPDCDEPVFECRLCNDGGYQGLKLCSCVKKMMASSVYENSVLGEGLSDKSFENFSLSYYRGESLENMTNIFEYCKKYVHDFPKDKKCGLLFYGPTGLGKTHLSAAVAKEVAEKGFFAVYESAQQIFDCYDDCRFGRRNFSDKDRYEKCDLLVIDDLGSECMTSYSKAQLFNIINLRMVAGKQTIISTNKTLPELKKEYGDRVFSRLLGEYRPMCFTGSDIRMQKIKGENK